MAEKAKLLITPKAYTKITTYAEVCDVEISGFACYNQRGIIDTVFPLLKQSCSAVETTLDDDALEEFINSGISKRANVHWHSHVNMGVFWSQTDEQNIASLGVFISPLVSIVVNKRGEYEARVDYFLPIRLTQKIELIPHYLQPQVDREKIEQEVKEKVVRGSDSIVISDIPTLTPATFKQEYWERYSTYRNGRYRDPRSMSDDEVRKMVEEEKERMKSRNGPNSDLFGGE